MKEVNQRRHVDWWKETRRLTLFSKKNVNITHFYQKRVKFSTTKASYLQRIREHIFWRKRWAAVSFVFIQFKFSIMKASHKYHAMKKWRKSIKEDTWIGGLKANSKEKDRQQHLLSSSNWKRQEREREREIVWDYFLLFLSLSQNVNITRLYQKRIQIFNDESLS